jgi:hypothetical protein
MKVTMPRTGAMNQDHAERVHPTFRAADPPSGLGRRIERGDHHRADEDPEAEGGRVQPRRREHAADQSAIQTLQVAINSNKRQRITAAIDLGADKCGKP